MALGRGNIEIDVRARGLGDSIAREVRTAERNIRPLSVSLNDKGFRQPLGRITGDLGEFQNALDASVARTLAFGAAVGVINSMANAFKGMVTSAIEVEKTLADVNVILNLTSSGLVTFSSNLFQVAQNTGQSFQTVSEAAVELARQGLGAEESLKRINDAMILTRLSGMDAAKSVASLTAAVNSFGDTAVTTTEVVNKLASVDAAFAVSTDDLANALARAGASAQGAKVDMDQLLAAVTSVQQTTARGGAVIGNAFKSIFTRLQRGGVREALEDIGVATMDAAGNIRGAMSVLQDYAGVYGTLSDSQRAYTDELIAGVFQINNLKALMKDLGSDYSIYTRALEQSAGATDEAERRNRSLQTTLSSLVNESSVSVKKLASALGGLVATPAIENLLTLFNSVAGALTNALDPEKGSKLIKGMFGAIGKFIAGPGLLIVGLAFVKLFKFIAGQSVRAVSEVFKINSATQKTAQIEGQITGILSHNKELYEQISHESLTHEQREEMVLQTLRAQTEQYNQQAAMISRLGQSKAVRASVRGVASASGAGGFVPRDAGGYVPNFANGMEGAIAAERKAITAGEGGASPSANTKVLNNFPIGGGRNETMVANTDEVIVPKFGGSSGSAIFNKDMIEQQGMPEGAIPVARGWIPNFALKGAGGARAAQKKKGEAGKSSLLTDPKFKQFWQGSGAGIGTLTIDTQEATQGFGIIGGRGSPASAKAGLESPLSNPDLADNFIKQIQSKLGVSSSEAKQFAKLYNKRKTSFTNIPVNTVSNEPINRKTGESMLDSPISNIIQPQMADAVEKVATKIYTKYFPNDFDTEGYIAGVRASVDKDKEIVSRSVEGGILESALKLGNKESAKNIGADESATWDFEPGGAIPDHLKKQFFGSKKVIRADAKRTVGDRAKGEVLKKAADEVFPAQLSAGMLGAIDEKVLKEARASFARKKGKADGFIPSFITSIPDRYTARGQQGGQGKIPGLRYNKDGKTLNGSFAYKIGDRMFKPAARANSSLKIIPGTTMGLDKMGNPKLDTIKEQGVRATTLRGARIKHNEARDKPLAIIMSTQPGHSYEEKVSQFMSNKYAKNSNAIDFMDIGWKGIAPIGPGGHAFTKKWKYADAYSGGTHGPRKIFQKMITEGLVDKAQIKAAEAAGLMDLTEGKAGAFAEIAGKAPNDAAYESSKTFSLSDKIFNKFNFPKPTGRDKGKKKKFGIKFNRDQYIANSGFIPNFIKGKTSGKGSELRNRWIKAVMKGGDIGTSMGLGRGGTESRATMPQLSKEAQKEFERDLTQGTGIAGEQLGGQKVRIGTGKEKVAGLKATQKDIYGDNVLSKLKGAFGAKWNKAGLSPMPGWLSAPIMVSQEKRILDGHHRWATVYARDAIDDGKLGGLSMATNQIGLPIQTLLGLAETYSGAKQAGGDTGAASGFIPNFANALDDAISREKEVLQAQGSSAQVYTATDSRVKGPQNPAGLLVANTRDEPRGGGQGVDRALIDGENPKTHGSASGLIPSFAKRGRSGRKADTTNIDGAAESVDNLNTASGKLKGGLMSLKGGMGFIETLSWKAAGAETAILGVNAVLDSFGMNTIPTLSGMVMKAKDAIQGLNRALIDAAGNYAASLEKEISATVKTIEQIDLFASTTAALGKSLQGGKIDVAGKQLQQLFITASKMEHVDPTKLQELIRAAGDSEAIARITQELKDLESQGDNIKMFAADFSTAISEVLGTQEGERRETKVKKTDVKPLVAKLTENLDPQQLAKVGERLKGIDTSSVSLAKTLKKLGPEIGQLPKDFLLLADTTPALGKKFLEALKDQTAYSAAIGKLSENFKAASLPVTSLSGKLSSLGQVLITTASSTSKAYEVLSTLADIEFKSQLEGAKSTGTVTQATALDVTAIYDVRKSIDSAAQDTRTAIQDFAGKVIETATGDPEKGGAISELSGPIAALVKSVEGGSVDNNAALAAVTEIASHGNAEQKTFAKELIATLHATNAEQVTEQLKIEATLKAQLTAINQQAVAYARNTQLNSGQLDAMAGISSGFDTSTGLQKTNLQKVSELSSVMKTIGDLGGARTEDFLAEIKESNAKLSQLENFKAALNQVTKGGGVPGGFDAKSLEGLSAQIDTFVGEGNFNKLGDQAKSLMTALSIGLEEQMVNSDGGVKGVEDLPAPVISTESINELANRLSVAVSEPIAKLLGVDADTAEALDVKLEEGLPEEIRALAAQNKANATVNDTLIKQQTEIVAKALAKGHAAQAEAAKQGLEAADALKTAASAILDASVNLAKAPTIDPAPVAAKGFVPSFSPQGAAVEKAVRTERKLGGKPVVDYHHTVGTYVRDGKTQPNFSAVRRDHPEGIRQASDNAKTVQGALSAEGYVPHFAQTAMPKTRGQGAFWLLKKTLGGLGGKKKVPVRKSAAQKKRDSLQKSFDENPQLPGAKTPKPKVKKDKKKKKKNKKPKDSKLKAGSKKVLGEGAKLTAVAGTVVLASQSDLGVDPDAPEPTIEEAIQAGMSGDGDYILPSPPRKNDETFVQTLLRGVEEMEEGFTGRGHSKLDEIIPKQIKDLGSQFPEIVGAAYFGGKRFSHSESSGYPPFVHQPTLNHAYAKAAGTMFNSGRSDLLKNVPDFSESTSSAIDIAIGKESSKEWQAAMQEFYGLTDNDFGGLMKWNKDAPHNDTWYKTLFEAAEFAAAVFAGFSASSAVAGAAMAVFPPASLVMGAISGVTGAISTGLAVVGGAGNALTGTNLDGAFGMSQKNSDLINIIDKHWDAGMFHEEASNYGFDADMIPKNSDEASANKLKLQAIKEQRGAILAEIFKSGAATLSPSLFPGVSSTKVGFGTELSRKAGLAMTGSKLSENEKLNTFLESGEGSPSITPAVGSLAGGPEFITDLAMIEALVGRVGNFISGGEEGRLNLPLTLGEEGGIKLARGSDITEDMWVPSSETSSWSLADLKKTGDQMWEAARETQDTIPMKKVGITALESNLKAREGSTTNPPTEAEHQQLADDKLWVRGLMEQQKGMRKGLDLVSWYENLMNKSGTLMGDTGAWMRKPSFPDPFKQKAWIHKASLVDDSQRNAFYDFERPDLGEEVESTVFNRGNGKVSAGEQLDDFFKKMDFGYANRGTSGLERTKAFIEKGLNKDSGRIASLLDPGTAKAGYAAANASLSQVQGFLSDSPRLWVDKLGVGIQEGANTMAAQDVDKVFKEGLFEGEGITKFEGADKIPTNPPDLGAEEAKAKATNIEQVRDAVYMRILGKQADEKRATSHIDEADTIKRLEAVRENAPYYKTWLDGVVQNWEKKKARQQKTADDWSTSKRHSEKVDIVSQTQAEIVALRERANSFSQGDKGLAELYYSSASRKPVEVNGRRVAPHFWDAPSTSLEDLNALVKRLGLEQTPAEERLKELEKGEGADKGIAGQLGLNWSQHLTDEQKSKNVGGYGFYAQIRNQSGNAGGQAFKDQFSSMAPEDRIQLMERLGVRSHDNAELGGSKVYEDLFSGNNDMAPLVKESLMRFAGEGNPAFGFMLDEIFQSSGANRERDAILNTVKGLGIPFNDVSPIGALLESSKVNLATINQSGGSDVAALPSEDISAMTDYLYDEQFKDWTERNKEKIKGAGVNPNVKYLNEILGEQNSVDLKKYPSFLQYLEKGGMLATPLEQHVSALLNEDTPRNSDKWKEEYRENAITTLTANTDYGQTTPNAALKTVPNLLMSGKNQLDSLELGDDIITQAQAVPAVMGDTLGHGISDSFQALVNPAGVPFPALGEPTGREEAIRKLWEMAKTKKPSYAPFGYTEEHQMDRPSGRTDMIESLINLVKRQVAVKNEADEEPMGAEEKAQRLAGPVFKDPFADMSQEEIQEMVQKSNDAVRRVKNARVGEDIDAAAGLVPNFAEILAKKKGEVKLINDNGKKYIQLGDGSSAILNDNGTLTRLPGDSSYLTSQIESLAAAAATEEVSLDSLGISPNQVEGGDEKSKAELIDLSVGNMVVDIKKLKRESSLNLDSHGFGSGIRGASGFVPNYSAVAGEIAASRTAGYKSPVTSSQVKTMNIPGAGKAAYNTQESVFKMPGVVQPFIRPPKSSDAAPSYAKEVKKKYNFNPYQNAAGGFVPNFKGGLVSPSLEQAILSFDGYTKTFGDSTDKFQTAVSKLNFGVFAKAGETMAGASNAFAKQSTVLSAAASKINEGAEKIAGAKSTSISLKPLTTAVGIMSASADKMAKSLGVPLELNTKTLEDTMSGLIAALGTIEGKIAVDISPVTIDVQGAGGIELSAATQSAIKGNIESIVESKINAQVPQLIKDFMK